MKIRVIGDIHGQYQDYFDVIKDCDRSIQIGDMGFDYTPLNKVDPFKHRFFKGNHDGYDKSNPHDLGDFGFILLNIFFIRGAWSIDEKYRTPGLDWFPYEQLSEKKLEEALELYKDIKPEIMLTHEAPYSLLSHLNLNPAFAYSYGYKSSLIKTRTNEYLDRMFKYHKPKLWSFGHYHQDFDKIIEDTQFVCLCTDKRFNCKQYLDIEV